jgi:hypothetical protein
MRLFFVVEEGYTGPHKIRSQCAKHFRFFVCLGNTQLFSIIYPFLLYYSYISVHFIFLLHFIPIYNRYRSFSLCYIVLVSLPSFRTFEERQRREMSYAGRGGASDLTSGNRQKFIFNIFILNIYLMCSSFYLFFGHLVYLLIFFLFVLMI